MKLHGKQLYAVHKKTLRFPRGEKPELDKDGQPTGRMVPFIVEITVQAVVDESAVDKILTRPNPPIRVNAGGSKMHVFDDPKYKTAVDNWAVQKSNWIALRALEATEGLEWETVDPSNPDTWGNFRDELQAAGFTPAEQNKIQLAINQVNGLTPDNMEIALQSFLP
jgi:hypothetical protein